MVLQYSVVDAFCTPNKPFSGNPASVVITDKPLSDDLMQNIAAEQNHSETAFVVPLSDATPNSYSLRWFTPALEARICGHATLAPAHELFERHPQVSVLSFETVAGVLYAQKLPSGYIELDFPATLTNEMDQSKTAFLKGVVSRAIGEQVRLLSTLVGTDDRLYCEVDSQDLPKLSVDASIFKDLPMRAVTLYTPLKSKYTSDAPLFHSRMFAPKGGIEEDPVTGSAHCALAVIFSKRLNAEGQELYATQGSKRQGEIRCVYDKSSQRVKLRGKAIKVARGDMYF